VSLEKEAAKTDYRVGVKLVIENIKKRNANRENTPTKTGTSGD